MRETSPLPPPSPKEILKVVPYDFQTTLLKKEFKRPFSISTKSQQLSKNIHSDFNNNNKNARK